MAQPTECPNCGKKGLIQRGTDLFQCLSCDFSRDLSKTEPGVDVTKILFMGFLVAVFFRFFQFVDSYRQPAVAPEQAAQVQVDPAADPNVYRDPNVY